MQTVRLTWHQNLSNGVKTLMNGHTAKRGRRDKVRNIKNGRRGPRGHW